MPSLLDELQGCPAYLRHALPRDLPTEGVYVFYEDGSPMYVGRSGRQGMRKRIMQHSRPSSGHNQATFAYALMVDALRLPTGHESRLTRDETAKMLKGPFLEQKRRVMNMEVRVVEIEVPVVQAVFEIYATVTLGTTRYNRFDTH